jgi:DNA-binding MarR family transcriptional regulator
VKFYARWPQAFTHLAATQWKNVMNLYFEYTRIIVDKFLSRNYPPAMQLEIAAKQLEALGNATRLAIYRDLIEVGHKGSPVGEIRKKLNIPASTLSHHIAKLVPGQELLC